MVSNDAKNVDHIRWGAIISMNDRNELKRKESRLETQAYLDKLKYAIESRNFKDSNFPYKSV